MAEREMPLYYETRREPRDGNVTRKRGRLRLFAVYAAKEKGGKLRQAEVKHNVMHATTGMEQGVANNEGRDLARTIVGHWLGTEMPHQTIYNAFCSLYIAQANPAIPLKITAEQMKAFMAGRQ